MQTIPGLKKCFEFVAGLSKTLLATARRPSINTNAQNTQERSPKKQQKPNLQAIQPPLSQSGQQACSSGQKLQGPKIICFEAFLQNCSNPLKSSDLRTSTGSTCNYQKPIQFAPIKQLKMVQNKGTQCAIKHTSSNAIQKRYSNQFKLKSCVSQQILLEKFQRKSYPPSKVPNDQVQDSADDELSDDERVELGKKDRKMLKKSEKNASVAQSIEINAEDMMFTYEDGDDISSIAAKSETTDEIEPQLLSFISKKASMNNFNKFDDNKINNFPSINMKKKSSHCQGETIKKKSPNMGSGKQDKNSVKEVALKPKQKRRAFQLYPGETFEQFKKRILVQNKSSSSENEDEENSHPGKHIKKEEYDKILSQLNSSLSKMEEQRYKQASILVVEKMVDESQNSDSEQQHQPKSQKQEPIEEIENYKVWNNQGDDSSFRLYFREL